MLTRHSIIACTFAVACSGDPHVVGVGNGGGGSTSSSPLGGSSLSIGGAGAGLGSGGSLGLAGAGSLTGGSVTTGTSGSPSQTGGAGSLGGGSAGTGGVNCGCVVGAYVPVCGTNGTNYDAACGDSCVPVPIACRHTCPCTATGGASSIGGSSALAATGGASSGGGTSSTSTGTSGLCGSGCDVAQTTIQSICTNTQVLLTCTAPYPSNLSTIMSVNGCTDSGLNMVAYCCPTLIETACKSLTI